MSPRYVVALITFLAVIPPAVARAGHRRPIQAGDEVRVTAPALTPRPLTGRLLAVDERELTLSVKGTQMTVPRGQITLIERRTRKSALDLRGSLWGLTGGATLGAAVGFFAGKDCTGGGLCFSRGRTAAMGAVVFGALGALAGLDGSEWEKAPSHRPRIRVGPVASRGRGIGVRVAVAF